MRHRGIDAARRRPETGAQPAPDLDEVVLHGLLAVFEPWGDPSFVFVSLVAAECKYRMSFQPRQVVFLWLSSFAGMLYERRLTVWIFPAISSLGLGDWTHQWTYTDKIYNGYGIYLVCALVFSACVVP